MKSLIPTTANDDFDASDDIFVKIKNALKIALARPHGKKFVTMTDYFDSFTSEQLDEFVDKLSESKWVRNPMCTYEFIVKQDLVNELLTNGLSSQVSKFYNIVTLKVDR